MTAILAIDPGPVLSAWVLYDAGDLLAHGIDDNDNALENAERACLKVCGHGKPDRVIIEMIASYGMPVGASVFNTCVWIGRFIERCNLHHDWDNCLMYRKEVKMHLCNSMRAKDSNVRQALIDRFPATGGGKCPQIGIKSRPGPLYGVSRDIWAALGVAVTWADQNDKT